MQATHYQCQSRFPLEVGPTFFRFLSLRDVVKHLCKINVMNYDVQELWLDLRIFHFPYS